MSEPAAGAEPFTARRCPECEAAYGHPPAACRSCGNEALEAVELPGRGRLYASTVIRVPGADHRGEAPYRVGIVDVGDVGATGESDAVRVTARIEGEGDLSPEQPLAFVGRRDGAFVFRPA